MVMQQTSLEAYNSIRSLGEKQKIVYEMLLNLESANNLIISRKLGWDVNRVTPRVLELRKFGLIIEDGIRECPITKRMTCFWKAVSTGNQANSEYKSENNLTSVSNGEYIGGIVV